MTSLTRWDPFQDVMAFQDEMNRLLGDTFRIVGDWPQRDGMWRLALDVSENEDAFIVQASVPGVNPDDLDINLLNNVLTIQGEIQPEESQGQIHLRELSYGKFYRSIRLPVAVDMDKAEATYHNGVLTLTLPKVEEAKPKRIAIHSNGQKIIEAQPA